MKLVSENRDIRIATFVFLSSLIVKLILMPWSQTIHADAVSRVFLALQWLQYPRYISEGYWGPLHNYMTAFSLWLVPGHVYGPKILNILFSSLTVIPLFAFTKNVFGNRTGATFVALIYGFCPIAMHNSFQALAGVSYAFFTVCSMYSLSVGLKRNGDLRFAALGGLAITLAAATRYESWVIIAAFTLVLLLFRTWKFTVVFWPTAMIFPATWMIGNKLEFGDFLYSVNQNDIWNVQMEGVNDNIDSLLVTERLIFFPASLAVGVSPVVVVFIVLAIVIALIKGSIIRQQLIWLIPFAVMAFIFMQKAYAGTLMMQHRFTLTWVVLLLPFLALVFQNESYRLIKMGVLTIAVASLIPMSYKWGWIDYTKRFDGNLGKALNQLAMETSHEFEAVPQLHDADVDHLVASIKSNSRGKDGLIIDFFGWDRSYYVALRSGCDSYLITSGGKHSTVGFDGINKYLTEHPEGLIILSRLGNVLDEAQLSGTKLHLQKTNYVLNLEPLCNELGQKLYRFEVLTGSNSDITVQEVTATEQIFGTVGTAKYYETAIRSDMNWFRRLQREGYWKGEPLDTTIAKNVRYMLEMDRQRNQ
jgi:hypothetical protein